MEFKRKSIISLLMLAVFCIVNFMPLYVPVSLGETPTSTTTPSPTPTSYISYDFYFSADTGIISNYDGKGGNVEIPSTINGVKVKSISEGTFLGCKGLTSITIPDGITSIGDHAFYECKGLTNITIPDR